MHVNALKLRQSLGSVLKSLEKTGEPIIIEKNRRPVAVLISLKSFQERFIDLQEKRKREQLIQRYRQVAAESEQDSLKILRELRYGSRN
jgi:prevent-host-death family protein